MLEITSVGARAREDFSSARACNAQTPEDHPKATRGLLGTDSGLTGFNRPRGAPPPEPSRSLGQGGCRCEQTDQEGLAGSTPRHPLAVGGAAAGSSLWAHLRRHVALVAAALGLTSAVTCSVIGPA